jgi:hypothetical protein
VLVTDAGARGADDPLSGTGLGAASLRQLARDKGIARISFQPVASKCSYGFPMEIFHQPHEV